MKVTRILFSKNLNAGKYQALEEQAGHLGVIRSEVWNRYGSMAGIRLADRRIRDQWLKQKRIFPVCANAWKETLRDAKADISMTVESAKVKVRQAIRRRTTDDSERKRFYIALKSNRFARDPYLSRLMRKNWKRGHNRTHNQIIVRSDNYTTFQLGGRAWIKIPSLEPGKRIAIPLNTTVEPTGTLRLILRDERVEIHYAINIERTTNCGGKTIGVDKGYSEVLVDSDGFHHGKELGKMLAAESDRLKLKNQRRAKLRALAKNTNSERKRQNILENNLGTRKRDHRGAKTKANIRDTVFKAAHAVVDKAATIAAEDLTARMNTKRFGKNINRRLSAWTKSIIAEALDTVSQRRGSTLILVNPAYTSQMDSRHCVLLGKRAGDSFHCFDGVVLQADENAAQNVKARLFDLEIDRWTPYTKVKSILLARTERFRLGLLNQDSSCRSQGLSTESEIPKNMDVQFCPSF
jgi:IS605 OrfB family transposase